MLSPEERQELLGIARESIARALAGDRSQAHSRVSPQGRGRPLAGRLAQPGGAFVTIKIGQSLRGCIGYIESPLPLAEVVREVAVKSATEDPRFVPMTQTELAGATLEISILSPLRQIADQSEIEVGKHGLLLESGRHRGLLLPQVATEYRWDRESFLSHTARKAGLPADGWKSPEAKIFVFSAEIINEEE
jgi:AmmeMemoRadiSam system protein A